MFKRQGIALAGFLLVLLAAGCAKFPLQPTPTAVPPTPLPSATPEPSATATATDVPTPTVTPTPACTATKGQVLALQIDSLAMAKPMQFNVYLPPCYDLTRQPGYPALYLLHGQTYNQGQWLRLGVPDTADRLISSGELPPFLIVMPYEEYSLSDPFTTGFGESVTNELVPWIDATYDTCAERACRAIGGLSRGGAWALHLGFSRWDLFGAIGGHSTPPFVGDGGRLSGWLAEIPAGENPRVYMDIGQDDPYRKYAEAFEKRLSGYGVEHVWVLNTGTHNEPYWTAHAEEYLRWYWGE